LREIAALVDDPAIDREWEVRAVGIRTTPEGSN
jgi:hypothetical protein